MIEINGIDLISAPKGDYLLECLGNGKGTLTHISDTKERSLQLFHETTMVHLAHNSKIRSVMASQ